MKLSAKLPAGLNFTSPDLMYATAMWMQKEFGAFLDGNLDFNNQYWGARESYALRIIHIETETHLSWYGEKQEQYISVSTQKEVMDVILGREEVIIVGDYKVEPSAAGIQVGCTFVPWEKVRQIASLQPKTEAQPSPRN